MVRKSYTHDPMIQTSIYIRESKLEMLKKISKKTRVPFAAYIREAIERIIRKYS